jgi:hypothetical protein
MPDVEDSLYCEGEPLCSGQVGQSELTGTAVLEFLNNICGG